MNLNGVYSVFLLVVPISGTPVEVLDRPVDPPEELVRNLLETETDNGGGSFFERHFTGSTGRSPYKLVYDVDCEDYESGEVGKWIKVEIKDCPIVFEDPYFEKHGYICNRDSGELPLDCNTEFEAMWSYPEYQKCKNVPVCHACPILAQCGTRTPPPPQIGAGFVSSLLTEVEYYRLGQLEQKHWLSEQDRVELSCLQEKQRGLQPSWTSCTQGSLRESQTGGHASHNIHVNVVQESSHQSTGTDNRHLSSHDQSGSARRVSGQSSSLLFQTMWVLLVHPKFLVKVVPSTTWELVLSLDIRILVMDQILTFLRAMMAHLMLCVKSLGRVAVPSWDKMVSVKAMSHSSMAIHSRSVRALDLTMDPVLY